MLRNLIEQQEPLLDELSFVEMEKIIMGNLSEISKKIWDDV